MLLSSITLRLHKSQGFLKSRNISYIILNIQPWSKNSLKVIFLYEYVTLILKVLTYNVESSDYMQPKVELYRVYQDMWA